MRACPVTSHFIGRLALEALQLRNVECRILRSDQLVTGHIYAAERSRCLLEIVAAIKHLCQHDFCIRVIWRRVIAFSSHFCASSSRLESNAMRPNWRVAEYSLGFSLTICE